MSEKAEIDRLRAAVKQGADLAYLAAAMIDQDELNSRAGWDCLQAHAGKMIDTAKELLK